MPNRRHVCWCSDCTCLPSDFWVEDGDGRNFTTSSPATSRRRAEARRSLRFGGLEKATVTCLTSANALRKPSQAASKAAWSSRHEMPFGWHCRWRKILSLLPIASCCGWLGSSQSSLSAASLINFLRSRGLCPRARMRMHSRRSISRKSLRREFCNLCRLTSPQITPFVTPGGRAEARWRQM